MPQAGSHDQITLWQLHTVAVIRCLLW